MFRRNRVNKFKNNFAEFYVHLEIIQFFSIK